MDILSDHCHLHWVEQTQRTGPRGQQLFWGIWWVGHSMINGILFRMLDLYSILICKDVFMLLYKHIQLESLCSMSMTRIWSFAGLWCVSCHILVTIISHTINHHPIADGQKSFILVMILSSFLQNWDVMYLYSKTNYFDLILEHWTLKNGFYTALYSLFLWWLFLLQIVNMCIVKFNFDLICNSN